MNVTLDPSLNGNGLRKLPPRQVETSPPTGKQKPILVLDGVRAIACLVVLSYHMSVLMRGSAPPLPDTNPLAVMLNAIGAFFASFGESAVILFFVLSGFLLFLPYAKALLEDRSWPSARRYYFRRIFRIVPAYYVTLLLMVAFFHPEFSLINHWHDWLMLLTFTMNLDLSSQINIPFWTLAIEYQFYLLVPIIAWIFSLVVRGGRPAQRMRQLSLCLLCLCVWGVVTRYLGLANAADLPLWNALKPYLYGDTSRYFDVFAIGMLLATAYTYLQSQAIGETWKVTLRQLNPFILAIGVALLVWLPFQHASHALGSPLSSSESSLSLALLVRDWMQWQVLGYSIAYSLCLWALLFGTARLKWPFEGAFLRWFGSISFSLYMWHLPFMLIFLSLIAHNIHTWNAIAQYGLFWCWTVVVILPISASFYRWVEKPGIRLGERLLTATYKWRADHRIQWSAKSHSVSQ